MLAEPRRRKRRIVDDPNNLRWANDNDKIGQKLLEKMGWRAGSGLGAKEQGRQDALAIRANVGSLGLGREPTSDFDVHSQHRQNFDVLLRSLNEGKDADAVGTGNDGASCSLTNLSKSSRRRIHYSRLAKGKELLSASSVDLATVTGNLKKQDNSTDNKIGVAELSAYNDLEDKDEKRGSVAKTFRVSFIKGSG